jgi:hypothetical protein
MDTAATKLQKLFDTDNNNYDQLLPVGFLRFSARLRRAPRLAQGDRGFRRSLQLS